MRCRLLSIRPRCSQPDSVRLTVCSVVPVIWAMSWRLIGKSISTPCSTLRPDCLASRSSACAMRCSTCCVDISIDAGVGLLQPASDVCKVLVASCRKFRHQARPCRRRPGQRDAVVDGGRGGGVTLQPDRGRNPKAFAGRDIAHHDLFAGRRGLAGAHMTVQQHEEGMGVLALLEYRAVLGKAQRAGLAKDFAELLQHQIPRTAADGRPAKGRLWPCSLRRRRAPANLDCDWAARSSQSLRWHNMATRSCP